MHITPSKIICNPSQSMLFLIIFSFLNRNKMKDDFGWIQKRTHKFPTISKPLIQDIKFKSKVAFFLYATIPPKNKCNFTNTKLKKGKPKLHQVRK